MADIGSPVRKITVVPLDNPVPETPEPKSPPVRQPTHEPQKQPELEPAR